MSKKYNFIYKTTNVLKKVVGNFNYDPIEVCSTPLVLTIK